MIKMSAASSISADLVVHLRKKEGMTLKRIGGLIQTSESFISRVSRGERSFTLDHMARFEEKLGQSIPVLLLESGWRKSVSRAKKGIFDEALRLLKQSAAIRADLKE